MKKIVWRKYLKISLEAIFVHLKNLFLKFPLKIFATVFLVIGTFALPFQVRRADPNILTALTWRKMFIANESYCGPSRYKEWWKQLLAPLLDSIWELHLHSWVYDFLGVSVFLSHPAHFSRYFSSSCL